MRKRLVLAFGALLVLVLLAGCSGGGSIDLRPVNDSSLASEASRTAPPLSAPPSDSGATVETDSGQVPLITHAIVNGSATAEATSPHVESGLPFEYDGSYYAVEHEVIDTRTGTNVGVRIDYDPENYSGPTLDYDDLSPADKRAVDGLLPPGEHTGSGYDFGVGVTYTDRERRNSTLASEAGAEYVLEYEGERYQLHVDDVREVTLRTYRYEATEVADSPEAYTETLTREHRFTLSGLSDAERTVVETAIEETYYVENGDEEAFVSVLDRFRNHSAVRRDDGHGEWVVRYDGQTYWAELYFGAYADE